MSFLLLFILVASSPDASSFNTSASRISCTFYADAILANAFQHAKLPVFSPTCATIKLKNTNEACFCIMRLPTASHTNRLVACASCPCQHIRFL